jgi:hypothetical protein
MKTSGIILMLIGLGLTVFTAFTFFTKEKVVDLGVVEVTRNAPHYINWSPFIGMAVMVIGAFLVLRARKNS